MKMTCIIVDDEPLAVKLLESYVARTPDLELVGSFADSISALAELQRRPVDLLLLDIQMPDLNGMELAHAIDNRRTRIVFTTAFKDYAFESYEVRALDFLLKPIRYVKFQEAISKAREAYALTQAPASELPETAPQMTQAPDSLFLRIDGEWRQLAMRRILYVEGMKDYLKFYVEGERSPWVTHMTMATAEEMLPGTQFMRISRSHIVSLSHIRSIDRNSCVYIGEQIIRVTDSYREAFDRYLSGRTAQ